MKIVQHFMDDEEFFNVKKDKLSLNCKFSEDVIQYFGFQSANRIDVQSASDERNAKMLRTRDVYEKHLKLMRPYHRVCYVYILQLKKFMQRIFFSHLIFQVSWLEFRYQGLVLPFGALNANHNAANRYLIDPMYGWTLSEASDPLSSWDMNEVIKVNNDK